MIRLAACFWSVVAVVMAVIVFQIKYAVQELEGELAAVNHQIVQDQEAIQVLRAEWSYLNRPERIAGLAERYLGLDPANEPQLVALEDLGNLPLRLEGVVIRPAGAGPLLPTAKPRVIFAAVDEDSAGEMPVPAPLQQDSARAQHVSATPPPVVRQQPSAALDPIAATLIKYGGAQ